MLRWIVGRCRGRAVGHETRIGWVPRFEDFDLEGLDGFDEEAFGKVMAFVPGEWRRELVSQGELFMSLYDRLPKELVFQRELLAARLSW